MREAVGSGECGVLKVHSQRTEWLESWKHFRNRGRRRQAGGGFELWMDVVYIHPEGGPSSVA